MNSVLAEALSAVEWEMISPLVWKVEGLTVRRVTRRRWDIDEVRGRYPTLTAAVRAIAAVKV